MRFRARSTLNVMLPFALVMVMLAVSCGSASAMNLEAFLTEADRLASEYNALSQLRPNPVSEQLASIRSRAQQLERELDEPDMATLRKAMVRIRKDHSRTAGEARDALQNPDDLNRLAVARWLLNDMGDKYHSGRTHAYSLKTLIDGNMFQSDRPSWLYQQYVGSLDAFAPRLRSSHDRLQAFYNTLSRIDRYDPRFNPHVHNERQLERVRPPPGIVEMLDHDAENGLWSTRPGHASFPRG